MCQDFCQSGSVRYVCTPGSFDQRYLKNSRGSDLQEEWIIVYRCTVCWCHLCLNLDITVHLPEYLVLTFGLGVQNCTSIREVSGSKRGDHTARGLKTMEGMEGPCPRFADTSCKHLDIYDQMQYWVHDKSNLPARSSINDSLQATQSR